MEIIYTSLMTLVFFVLPAYAGNTIVPTPRPEVTPPVALSCERYLVPGTNYFNYPAGCVPPGNDKNDDLTVADVDPQEPDDECSYNGKH